MTHYQKLLLIQAQKLLKALVHLDYSYHKICLLPTDVTELNEETLETWESFSARLVEALSPFFAIIFPQSILLKRWG